MARRRIMSDKWDALYTGIPMMEDLVYYAMPEFIRYSDDDYGDMGVDYLNDMMGWLQAATWDCHA